MHPIARWRLSKGLTQTQLARLVGVALTSAQGWEKGSRPRPSHLTELAKIFEVTTLELLDEITKWKAENPEGEKPAAAQ
jgi:transcriptional regulator with XRE-family HTH domain